MYFLDSNICIYFIKGKYERIKTRILTTPPNQIKIPSIVKAELLYGAFKSDRIEDTVKKLDCFFLPFEIVPFTNQMTYTYAEIRSRTESKGATVGPNDLVIASIVKFHDGILVTNNVREFERVPGLKVENWAG